MVDRDHCINTAFTEQQEYANWHTCACMLGMRARLSLPVFSNEEQRLQPLAPFLGIHVWLCEAGSSLLVNGGKALRIQGFFYSTCTQDIVSKCKLTSLTRLEITVHRTQVACTHHITAVSAHQELSTGTCRLHVCWGHEQTVIDVCPSWP